MVNAIVRLYGAPEYINVEVGRDLGRSFADRERWKKQNDDNQKKRDKAVEAIAGHLHCAADKVKPIQVERYRLYQEQDGKAVRPLILKTRWIRTALMKLTTSSRIR